MNVFDFFRSAGVPVVVDDEVGYQRAKKFAEEIDLSWSKDWYIYGGKIFVKPENKGELQQRLGANSQES